MSRPTDGLCAHCHRKLPKEHYRDWLTQGTDRCAKCGHAAASRVTSGPRYRAWVMAWKEKLDSCLRVMARVR